MKTPTHVRTAAEDLRITIVEDLRITIVEDLRITIVEDDPAIALLERRTLERAGHTVTIYSDGQSAITHVSAQLPDALILDHNLPDMTGLELFDALGPHLAQVPVIMVTGQGNESLAVAVLKKGVADYLVKDAKLAFIQALPRVVQRAVERTRLQIHNRQLQAQLRGSEAHFRHLVERSTVVAWELDWDSGRLEYIGPQVQHITGYQPAEWARPRAWLEHLHPADRARTLKARIAATQRGENHTLEYRVLCQDGRAVWIQDEVAVECLPDGGRVLRGVSSDISVRKRAEEQRLLLERQLNHAQKLRSLGALAGGVAHDFNNLLVGILGNAELAMLDLAPNSAAFECVEAIERAAKEAAALTQQMLTYSGRAHFSLRPTSLAALSKILTKLLRIALPKRVSMKTDFADELPNIEVDPQQIQQVVMNLVINAGESIGPDGGEVTLTTGLMTAESAATTGTLYGNELTADTYAFLVVEDDGAGMDADTAEKIFEPFFTTRFQGRGLGLAAALGIVQSHKGAISVHTEPGQGSRFTVFLPISDRATLPPSAPTDASGDWRGRGTVLVIDDEPLVRRYSQRSFSRWGFEVLTADGGRAGLEILQAQGDRIVLVMLDMTMPDMDGDETLVALRALRPELPVILSSGYTVADLNQTLDRSGPTQFIQKPYRLQALERLVRTALEPKRTQR